MGIGKKFMEAVKQDGSPEKVAAKAREGKRREAPYRPNPDAKPIENRRPPANW